MRFPILAFHSNYVPLAPFLRYSQILVENRRFETTPPLAYLAPTLGMTQLEFRRDLWHQQTIVSVLSYGVVCVILA